MKLFFLFTLLSAVNVFAFSEIITADTQHCLHCHTSVDGNGLLNSNGKIFAQSFAQEPTNYLQFSTPDWLQVGAKTKLLQSLFESSHISSAKSSLDLINVSTLLTLDKTQILFTVERYIPTEKDVTFKDFAYAPEYYLQNNLFEDGDQLIKLKMGRYKINYGINLNNNTLIKTSLTDSSIGAEKLQAEIRYNQAQFQISLSKIFNRFNYNKINTEDGYLIHLSFFKKDYYQFGFNTYKSQLTDSDGVKTNKQFEGFYLINRFNDELSLQTQVDQFHYDNNKKGISFFTQPKYLIQKGLIFFATLEYSNQNIEISDPKFQAVGLGIDYYPFTQTSINITYKNQKNTALNDSDSQTILASLNLYM